MLNTESHTAPQRSHTLTGGLTSDYVNAANRLKGKNARQRIVAYVESYDDVLFWRMVLSQYEDKNHYFEVMLPTRRNLNKGKKQALLSLILNGVGKNMIACVDADYDYLLQGKTPLSRFMLNNPYVFHTYVYAIENYQCFAPSLHNVCVMATMNDHNIFDFETFLAEYSRAVFPLFVWSIMLYRRGEYGKFTITDFNKVVALRHTRLNDVRSAIDKVRHKVHVRIQELQRNIPNLKEEYLATKKSIIDLGVTPDTTYLYIQGHHLFDNVVSPTLQTVCDELRREQEHEIRRKAQHSVQLQNELSAYSHSQSDITQMLKKNMGYITSQPYQRLRADISSFMSNDSNKATIQE
jgi:hypothetical protein